MMRPNTSLFNIEHSRLGINLSGEGGRIGNWVKIKSCQGSVFLQSNKKKLPSLLWVYLSTSYVLFTMGFPHGVNLERVVRCCIL